MSHGVGGLVHDLGSPSKHGVKFYAYDILKQWLRTGLLTADGAKWKERRHLLTGAFHFQVRRREAYATYLHHKQ